MRSPRPIFLLTDFGAGSYYPGVMRGVIVSHLPAAQVLDITHGIRPGDIREAGFVLEAAVPFLPPQAVVVAVVDPGVGTERRILLAEGAGPLCLAPDNGLLTGLLSSGWRARAVERPDLFLAESSRTFHGRDVFAPLAVALADGLDPQDLGPAWDRSILQPGWHPRLGEGEARGTIVHIDTFGNLVSNISGGVAAPNGAEACLEVGGRRIVGLHRTYGEVPAGEVLAYVGSTGHLEVAVRDGRADIALSASCGDPVRCTFSTDSPQ